jgi:hypothetical protein
MEGQANVTDNMHNLTVEHHGKIDIAQTRGKS